MPWWKTVEVVIYNWPSAKANAKLSGSEAAIKTSYDSKAHALHVQIPDAAGPVELRIGD